MHQPPGQRQLKGDGTYTEWTTISPEAKGTTFSQQTEGAGIFQLRASLGREGHFLYVRTADSKHAANAKNIYNEILRRGKPNMIGIVDADWQITMVTNAQSYLGRLTYAKTRNVTIYPGSPSTKDRNKCNIFVYHRGNASGAPVPLDWSYFSARRFGQVNMPPKANHWADSSRIISGWTFISNSGFPQPGFVVIYGRIEPISGHMGILNYDGTWINAGEFSVNQSIHLSTNPNYQPATFRNYAP